MFLRGLDLLTQGLVFPLLDGKKRCGHDDFLMGRAVHLSYLDKMSK
jgi:hypothetical protein